jgi:hypothetical protein
VGWARSANDGKGTCIVIGKKAEENMPLGRPRRRCVDNIKIDLVEIGWGGVDWIGVAQDSDK